jgi:hypothetical protein
VVTHLLVPRYSLYLPQMAKLNGVTTSGPQVERELINLRTYHPRSHKFSVFLISLFNNFTTVQNSLMRTRSLTYSVACSTWERLVLIAARCQFSKYFAFTFNLELKAYIVHGPFHFSAFNLDRVLLKLFNHSKNQSRQSTFTWQHLRDLDALCWFHTHLNLENFLLNTTPH